MNVRAELARLIQAGMGKRSPVRLYSICKALFSRAHESLAWDTFTKWVMGEAFPANRKRQDLLGDAVGGAAGAAIKRLKGLNFRGYRKRVMREKAMSMKLHAGHGLKAKREFPWVMRDDGSGKLVKQAQITCSQCGATYHHGRRGKQESDAYFMRRGWEVGERHAEHDLCPLCVASKRKVVKMSDHIKKTPAAPNGKEAPKIPAEAASRSMEPDDRRLLSRFIEDHWDLDVHVKAYRLGWNDQRIAEECGVPLAWVKEVRELLFGASGEDPGVAEFIKGQVEIRTGQMDINDTMKELMASVSQQVASFRNISEAHNAMLRGIAGVQQKQGALAAKVAKLSELAEKIQHPFDKAG